MNIYVHLTDQFINISVFSNVSSVNVQFHFMSISHELRAIISLWYDVSKVKKIKR